MPRTSTDFDSRCAIRRSRPWRFTDTTWPTAPPSPGPRALSSQECRGKRADVAAINRSIAVQVGIVDSTIGVSPFVQRRIDQSRGVRLDIARVQYAVTV